MEISILSINLIVLSDEKEVIKLLKERRPIKLILIMFMTVPKNH